MAPTAAAAAAVVVAVVGVEASQFSLPGVPNHLPEAAAAHFYLQPISSIHK
jgi:hypothetical protein